MQHELLSRSRCCTRATRYRKRGSAMIRTWHLVPILAWVVAMSAGFAVTRRAGDSLQHYCVGGAASVVVAILCAVAASLTGRWAMQRTRNIDPRQIGLAAIFMQQGVVLLWICVSGVLSVVAVKWVLRAAL